MAKTDLVNYTILDATFKGTYGELDEFLRCFRLFPASERSFPSEVIFYHPQKNGITCLKVSRKETELFYIFGPINNEIYAEVVKDKKIKEKKMSYFFE